MEADDDVENALGVSLIEGFAWGEERDKAALRDAMPLLGPVTREIASTWEGDLEETPGRRPKKKRAKRPSRRTEDRASKRPRLPPRGR